MTGLDTIGIPVAVAVRPNSRSLAVSQGKGLTAPAARASALMESLELYHAEHAALPLLYESHAELTRTHVLADVGGLARTPNREFQPSRLMPWAEGYDLLSECPTWVPYELVHTNFTADPGISPGVFNASSNGLASGNHVLEAISHGLCEVVERHSTTMWNHLDERRQTASRIDLSTVDDPDCRDVLDKYDRAGVAVGIWDTTTDIGLPAFLCTIVDRVENRMRPLHAASGMGCHPTRHIALLRALTEAAQSRLTVTTGSRDDVTRREYERYQAPGALAMVRSTLIDQAAPRPFSLVPSHDADFFDDDVRWQLERLRATGVRQVIVVDLTKPDIQIPVVRVIVPGLEGIFESPDYVPGPRARRRLAEVE